MSGLNAENRALESVYREYLSGSVSESDFQKSGYIGRGDRLLFFKGGISKENSPASIPEDESSVNLGHMRLIWIILSALIMIFLFSRLIRSGESADE